MPVPKRYFKVTQEINRDPEMWELTDTFGDRALRIWLELLATFDRTSNRYKVSGPWVAQLATATQTNLKTVVRVVLWMIDREWLSISCEDRHDGDEPQAPHRTAADWLQTGRRLAANWPQTHRRTAADAPQNRRTTGADWVQNDRRLVLAASNWLKYNRSQEQKRNEPAPLLSDPFPSPSLSPPRTVQKEEEKKEKRVKTSGGGASTPRRPRARPPSKSGPVWDAYATAYASRYRVTPVRNATVNTILSHLVDRLGQDEAATVAAFYVTHNGQFYVTKRHPVNLLLADAEGLRTQWATGVKATSREAKNAEFQDNLVGQVERVNQILDDRKKVANET